MFVILVTVREGERHQLDFTAKVALAVFLQHSEWPLYSERTAAVQGAGEDASSGPVTGRRLSAVHVVVRHGGGSPGLGGVSPAFAPAPCQTGSCVAQVLCSLHKFFFWKA